MNKTYARSQYGSSQSSKYSYLRRLFGSLAGKKDVFEEIGQNSPYKQGIFNIVFFTVLNFGLLTLSFYFIYNIVFGDLFGEIYTYLLLLTLFVLFVAAFTVLAIFLFSKMAGGKGDIKTASAHAGFFYPYYTLLLVWLALSYFFVYLRITKVLALVYLLAIFWLLFMFINYIRSTSYIYGISKGKATFIVLLVTAIKVGVYFGLYLYVKHKFFTIINPTSYVK